MKIMRVQKSVGLQNAVVRIRIFVGYSFLKMQLEELTNYYSQRLSLCSLLQVKANEDSFQCFKCLFKANFCSEEDLSTNPSDLCYDSFRQVEPLQDLAYHYSFVSKPHYVLRVCQGTKSKF